MSQIDITNFLPVIFWFWVLFFLLYFFNYSYLVPSIFFSLWLRENMFIEYVNHVKVTFYYFVLMFFFKEFIELNFSNLILDFLKKETLLFFNYFWLFLDNTIVSKLN